MIENKAIGDLRNLKRILGRQQHPGMMRGIVVWHCHAAANSPVLRICASAKTLRTYYYYYFFNVTWTKAVPMIKWVHGYKVLSKRSDASVLKPWTCIIVIISTWYIYCTRTQPYRHQRIWDGSIVIGRADRALLLCNGTKVAIFVLCRLHFFSFFLTSLVL